MPSRFQKKIFLTSSGPGRPNWSKKNLMESQSSSHGSNAGAVGAFKFAREGTRFRSQTRAGTRRDFKLATEKTRPSRSNQTPPTAPRHSARNAESFYAKIFLAHLRPFVCFFHAHHYKSPSKLKSIQICPTPRPCHANLYRLLPRPHIMSAAPKVRMALFQALNRL